MYNFLANTKRMTVAAMVMALYIVILYVTQGISFGPYQLRIATSRYALASVYPFLVVPLGLANFVAHFLLGRWGLIDRIGGGFVGIVTAWFIVQVRQRHYNPWLAALPIWWVPTLCVSAWLSYLLNLPYAVLVSSLAVGQLPPAICGVLLIQALSHRYILKKEF